MEASPIETPVEAPEIAAAPEIEAVAEAPRLMSATKTESAEEREARLADCIKRNIQPVKFEYLLEKKEKAPAGDDRDQSKKRGMNKKRPRDGKADITKTCVLIVSVD